MNSYVITNLEPPRHNDLFVCIVVGTGNFDQHRVAQSNRVFRHVLYTLLTQLPAKQMYNRLLNNAWTKK